MEGMTPSGLATRARIEGTATNDTHDDRIQSQPLGSVRRTGLGNGSIRRNAEARILDMKIPFMNKIRIPATMQYRPHTVSHDLADSQMRYGPVSMIARPPTRRQNAKAVYRNNQLVVEQTAYDMRPL